MTYRADETNVLLDGEHLTVSDIAAVARNSRKVALAPGRRQALAASRAVLDAWVQEEKIVYGITTGFGPFVSTLIPAKYQTPLQENLIRSHAANVGPIFPPEETRAAMLLRLNVFAKGYSAIREETVDLLCAMLNAGVHPQIPQWGSVGASGDLNPSAHIALALMGEGMVEYQGQVVSASHALSNAGLNPITFLAKEGLALINGTTVMTGVGSLQVADAWNLVATAEILSALAIEALGGSSEPFFAPGHEVKPHPGQITVAAHLRHLLEGSMCVWTQDRLEAIREELRQKLRGAGDVVDSGISIQNVYSLRAVPQILGAVRDALTYVTERITTEANSSNDNPLFFPELQRSYQGANFHGQTVALPMDVLAIALTEIGVLSERQLNKLLDPVRNAGLSPFLARGKSGLRCGLEGAQYVATSLVAECRTLCNPASIQSIPSNGENQDVVSMGLVAARKARDIKERIEYILAVECLALCEALEERDRLQVSPAGQAVYACVRERVGAYDTDREMRPLLETVRSQIHAGALVAAVERVISLPLT